ncbi:hypothetical protein [Ensifer canadensis]
MLARQGHRVEILERLRGHRAGRLRADAAADGADGARRARVASADHGARQPHRPAARRRCQERPHGARRAL